MPGQGQHLTTAQQMLAGLRRVTDQPGGDAQVKATVAVAHSVLALAEQVAMLRNEIHDK